MSCTSFPQILTSERELWWGHLEDLWYHGCNLGSSAELGSVSAVCACLAVSAGGLRGSLSLTTCAQSWARLCSLLLLRAPCAAAGGWHAVIPTQAQPQAGSEKGAECWPLLVDKSPPEPIKVSLRDGLVKRRVLSHAVCSAMQMPMYKHIRFRRISCQVLGFTMLTALNKFFLEITDLLGSYPSEGKASHN